MGNEVDDWLASKGRRCEALRATISEMACNENRSSGRIVTCADCPGLSSTPVEIGKKTKPFRNYKRKEDKPVKKKTTKVTRSGDGLPHRVPAGVAPETAAVVAGCLQPVETVADKEGTKYHCAACFKGFEWEYVDGGPLSPECPFCGLDALTGRPLAATPPVTAVPAPTPPEGNPLLSLVDHPEPAREMCIELDLAHDPELWHRLQDMGVTGVNIVAFLRGYVIEKTVVVRLAA